MIVIVMPTIGNGMHAITDPTVNLAACGILNNSAYPPKIRWFTSFTPCSNDMCRSFLLTTTPDCAALRRGPLCFAGIFLFSDSVRPYIPLRDVKSVTGYISRYGLCHPLRARLFRYGMSVRCESEIICRRPATPRHVCAVLANMATLQRGTIATRGTLVAATKFFHNDFARPNTACERVTYASEEPGMPATTINFVRHGKVYNPDHLLYERLPDFHLSERGRRMAQATGRYIAQSPQLNTAVAVYSSPLDRTRETANEILLELNKVRAERGQEALGLLTDERIIEAGNEFRGTRIGHGEGALWKPRNLKLVRNLWTPSWGESYRSIAARVQDFALEKVHEYPGEQIVVVTHESPIWSYRHMLETGHPEHNMLLRKTALASVTSITYDSETGKVISITYADPAKHID